MENFVVALDAGWKVETPNNRSDYSRPDAFCYLTLHGQRYGRIRVKECLFEEIAEGVPPSARLAAIKQVAMNREKIEDVFRYNKENSQLFGSGV